MMWLWLAVVTADVCDLADLTQVELPVAQCPEADGVRALISARKLLDQDQPKLAASILKGIHDPSLEPLVARERARTRLARKHFRTAARELLVLWRAATVAEKEALVLPLAEALQHARPASLVERFSELSGFVPSQDGDAMLRLWALKRQALLALGRTNAARDEALQAWILWPHVDGVAAKPPAGTFPTPVQLLQRAQVLTDAHRSELVQSTLEAVVDESLDETQRCTRHFLLGVAARKLHQYDSAASELALVMGLCGRDVELRRRAAFLHAKVVSIARGLAAIEPIERFALDFAGHNMVDDVWFWAGDLHQRRGQDDLARGFYARIEEQVPSGDHCASARWRRAWMALRAGRPALQFDEARTLLLASVQADGCVRARTDQQRARYWLGRVEQLQGELSLARGQYETLFSEAPLTFYGQQSLARLAELSPSASHELPLHQASGARALCSGTLTWDVDFRRGLAYLSRGLQEDAARSFTSLRRRRPQAGWASEGCAAKEQDLMLALLLEQAGEQRAAQDLLRGRFAEVFASPPEPTDVDLWRAAYPLAFRDELQAAEQAHGLPAFFLQALAREESAFDPKVVSWAGAVGLTQLLLSSAREAGARMQPPIEVGEASDLHHPGRNAMLGGAQIRHFLSRYGEHLGLALAAYNASDSAAQQWWDRHQSADTDVFVEELTIQETRDYVRRVLETFGIYRWLYQETPPVLAVAPRLPTLPVPSLPPN